MIDVNERALGTIPVSIPTAMALEAVVYDTANNADLWINIRSLIRNCIGSFDGAIKPMLLGVIVGEVVVDEMNRISSLVRQIGRGGNLVFYWTTRESMWTSFKGAIPKAPVTPKQIHEFTVTEDALLYVINNTKIDIKKFDTLIRGQDARAMIITHQPVDLLSRYEFAELTLLESHTGALKGPSKWSSKLIGKGSENMPFNALTLQIFGDGETFAAYPRKLKVELIELSIRCKWTPITTQTKMRADIMTLSDRGGAELLVDMLSRKPR